MLIMYLIESIDVVRRFYYMDFSNYQTNGYAYDVYMIISDINTIKKCE